MTRIAALSLLLCALLAPPALAFYHHLSPEQVREAYFLGRHGQQAREFLGRYEKEFPSSSGPGIDFSRVQILTPYAQIVSASFSDLLNDNAVDADQMYGNRSFAFLINVWVFCSSANGYSGVPFESCANLIRHSSIVVSQASVLKPQSLSYVTLYTSTKDATWPYGIEIELHLDASQFRPAPVEIAVSAPDGQHADATFDLSTLK
jgi:hypothetical protein